MLTVGKLYTLSLWKAENATMNNMKVRVHEVHDNGDVTIEIVDSRLLKSGYINRVPVSGDGWERHFEECE